MKPSLLPTRAVITGFIVLVLGTIVSVNRVEQYQVLGHDLLQNNHFVSGLSGWEKSNSGKIILHNNLVNLVLEDSTDDVRIEQKIHNPSDYQYLRLAADIKTAKIVPGKKTWHRARLILSSYDTDGNWLAVPHGVAGLEGTNDWQHFERIFKLSPLADQVKVIAMLHKASGSVWFKNIRLTQITTTSTWKALTLLALLGWGVFLFMILSPWIMGSKGFFEKILIISIVSSIIGGTLVPHSFKELLKTNSPARLAENPRTSLTSESVTEKSIESSKLSKLNWKMINNTGHFFLFLILAAVLGFNFPDKNYSIFLTILMLACATELMQFFIEGRGPGFGDLMLDLGGALPGGLALKTIIRAKREKLS